ncbi:MAG: 50S ribosomal protein L29 [Pseudanabaenaceae cyanobacterium bins.68]|nr:50S ribosomal protein L29 [Pseudanabaenaceae cyanobacterium bins.68]
MSDLRNLTDEQISEQILATKRSLFSLRMKLATRQPVKPHEFKHEKHKLGQLMTLEHERKLDRKVEAHKEVESAQERDS